MYYIITALIYAYDSEKEINVLVESAEFKIDTIKHQLFLTPPEVRNQITKVILLNPNPFEIKPSDIKDYLLQQEQYGEEERELELLRSIKVLNRDQLKINPKLFDDFSDEKSEVIETQIAGSLDISAIQNEIKNGEVIFWGEKIDELSLKYLLIHKNLIGYRKTYNVESMHADYFKGVPITDTMDYLHYLHSKYYEYTEKYYPKKAFSLYDRIKHNKGRYRFSRLINDIASQRETRLIIEIDDELLTKSLAVEIREYFGQYSEYDCSKNEYHISDAKHGYIFYNVNCLSPDKLYSLCKELSKHVYLKKTVILFSKGRLLRIGDLGFNYIEIPSINDDNILKLKLLLYLVENMDPSYWTYKLLSGDAYPISHLKNTRELLTFIEENKITSNKSFDREFWYDLKLKCQSEGAYNFEHIIEQNRHIWKITGPGIENPIKKKYYPNKCLMYLTYLMKTSPDEIPASDLSKKIENWIAIFAKERSRLIIKKLKKNTLNPVQAAKNIDEVFRDGLGKNNNNSDLDEIKFLYTGKHITIGKYCSFDTKKKFKVNVLDEDLEKLLSTK